MTGHDYCNGLDTEVQLGLTSRDAFGQVLEFLIGLTRDARWPMPKNRNSAVNEISGPVPRRRTA